MGELGSYRLAAGATAVLACLLTPVVHWSRSATACWRGRTAAAPHHPRRGRRPFWPIPRATNRGNEDGVGPSLVDKLVPDDPWALVQALLPTNPPPYGGRHRTIGDRNCSAAA